MIFSGNLRDFDLIELLKFLNSIKKTGVLNIKGNRTARIILKEGGIEAVNVPSGFEHIHIAYLALLDDGQFDLSDGVQSENGSNIPVVKDTTSILLEMARDRESPPDPCIYGRGTVFVLRKTSEVAKSSLNVDEWKVISTISIEKSPTIDAIAQRQRLEASKIQWILYSLERAGFIGQKGKTR